MNRPAAQRKEHPWPIPNISTASSSAAAPSVEGELAYRNSRGGNERMSYRANPHAVFSDPEVAAVGLTEGECRTKGLDYRSARLGYADVVKGKTIGAPASFAKLLVEERSERILGCHIIGPEAAILIHEVVVVTMNAGGATADVVRRAIHVHPSLSELVGTLFVYGALSGEPTPFPLITGMNKALTMRDYTLFEIIGDGQRSARGKRFVTEGLESGGLKPTVARTFAFNDMVEAHNYMESNQQFGTIVVTVP